MEGMLLAEENLSDGRRQSLARTDHAAVAILTAEKMLHATSRCESVAKLSRNLDEGVVEGSSVFVATYQNCFSERCGRNSLPPLLRKTPTLQMPREQ